MKDGEVAIIGGSLKEGWGLSFVELIPQPKGDYEPEGKKELAKYLSEGYEPFAVTTQYIIEVPKGSILTGKPPQGTPIQIEKVWLRVRSLLKKDPIASDGKQA